MGLTGYVYKGSLGDCSNGGLSGKVEQVTIVNVSGPSEPNERAPAVLLVEGNLRGIAKIVPAARTAEPDGVYVQQASLSGGRDIGPMMGGCYVATSDSRFSRAVEAITGSPFSGAVPFHDRFETAEQYRALSQ